MGIHGINVLYDKEEANMSDQHYDEKDVPAALQRVTSDGSGFDSPDELPESDFESFAEDDVEEEISIVEPKTKTRVKADPEAKK